MFPISKFICKYFRKFDNYQMLDGNKLREKRKKLGLSAEKLASLLGVTQESLYKWEKGTQPSNPDHYLRLTKWLLDENTNVLEESTIPYKAATKSEPLQIGDKSELLDIMRERIQDLKQDKEWLKKNLEFSLTGLAVGQKSILAHVSTILEKDDERDAAGNKKKEQTLKDDTGRRIGDKLSGSSQMDTSLSR